MVRGTVVVGGIAVRQSSGCYALYAVSFFLLLLLLLSFFHIPSPGFGEGGTIANISVPLWR